MDAENIDDELNIEILKLCLLVKLYLLRMKNKKRRRSCAVRKLMKERREVGYFHALIPSMRLSDVVTFKNFHRMDQETFEELLTYLGPSLRMQPSRPNEEISPAERLAITLRFLASGDSMKSVGFYGFRIGASTTSIVIRETCNLIWQKMQFVFPTPSEEMWQNTANEFYNIWGFPNCLGAIDGKHVVVQAFPHHNSLTFNYKHTHSLLLMAVTDAKYKFIMVDIGALGHNSDGGVFKTSKFGNAVLLHPEQLHLPNDKPLPQTDTVAPFVFIGDEAFPLRVNIMRPYPGRNARRLPKEEMVFNKRLSRARMVVENSFGILSSRFRIYRRPIIACKETVNNIIKATVCLHNWLRDKSPEMFFDDVYFADDNNQNLQTEQNVQNDQGALISMRSSRSNHARTDAVAVRQIYTKYFMEERM